MDTPPACATTTTKTAQRAVDRVKSADLTGNEDDDWLQNHVNACGENITSERHSMDQQMLRPAVD